jgi:hypothetical protein
MCEVYFAAVDRHSSCAKLRDDMRDVYKKIAREV